MMICRSCRECENRLKMMPDCTKSRSKDIIGLDKDGAWAEYCVVSEDQIYKLDSCLNTRHGKGYFLSLLY